MIFAFALLAAHACAAPVPQEAGGDYLNPSDRSKLAVVEAYHFTPEVEGLQRGTSGPLGGDIGYTLEHFPNHYRALSAMARLTARLKLPQAPGARFSTVCYFERALQFAQDDPVIHRLYAQFLLQSGEMDAALAELEAVTRLSANDAEAWYNLGLLRLKKRDFEGSRACAREAYSRGFPLPGLRDQLRAAGFAPD